MSALSKEWPVRLGTEGWIFHRCATCGAEGTVTRFYGASSAMNWAQRFQGDARAMSALRRVVADHTRSQAVWQFGDHAFLLYLAGLLGTGAWHVHCVPRPKIAGGTRQDVAVPESRPIAPPKKASEAASIVVEVLEELDTFSDGAITAAGLRAASASGVPFCEECAKAAAMRAASA